QPQESRSAQSDHGQAIVSEGRRILVAEDREDSATSLAVMLQMLGNEVRIARNGLEAVELVNRFRPDVIFLDIGLPGLNGYDACRRIREQPLGSDMMVVALTGWGRPKTNNALRRRDLITIW